MSVKHALLALLSVQPSSTYQLRKRFDASTGQTLPLNIGQVSTTLQRLERNGLVARDAESAGRSEDGGAGQLWRLSAAGRDELAGWWAQPVVAEHRGRDELVIKLALAAVTPGVDLEALVQTQRAAAQRSMHDLTRLRREVKVADLVDRLVLDHHIFSTEAELRWLDDVETALMRVGSTIQSGALQGAPVSAPTSSVESGAARTEVVR
ncbi:MAG: PadR family transcriptional regulator [Microbacterium gubbeenense]|uniref:PadR family transcriptional regulator n=1 Tax=Microbacterium gubbeenense TaxID=159896 RepID=UPI00042237D0|nr:PadR family transcriptional regulator [Microbacterium gubbeenense]